MATSCGSRGHRRPQSQHDDHHAPNTPLTTTDDEDGLLNAVARGDEPSFRVLYRRHAGRVYAMARRLAGDGDAADVAQEAWYRAVKNLPRFRGESAFSTWIVGIAVRCALESLKRRGAPLETVEPDDFGVASPRPDLRMDLEAALAGLAPGYRAVLVLHDIEGYTHQEIAELLGIEAGTAKSQLSRARRAMRARLGAPLERTAP